MVARCSRLEMESRDECREHAEHRGERTQLVRASQRQQRATYRQCGMPFLVIMDFKQSGDGRCRQRRQATEHRAVRIQSSPPLHHQYTYSTCACQYAMRSRFETQPALNTDYRPRMARFELLFCPLPYPLDYVHARCSSSSLATQLYVSCSIRSQFNRQI